MKHNRGNSFTVDVAVAGPSEYNRPTGPLENFQAAIGMTMLDSTSYGGAFWHDHNAERRRKVYDLAQSDPEMSKYLDNFRGLTSDFGNDLDYNLAAKYLQEEHGIHDILTDEQIKEKNQIQEEQLLGYGRKVQANATPMGKVAGFLGTIPAFATDPFFAASMLIPVGQAARGASLLTRLAYAGGKTALTEGALEMVRQPLIANWKTEMGRDYDLTQGLTEIAMAAGGAGLLGSVAELAKGIRVFRKHTPKDLDPVDLTAAKNLDTVADLMEKAPDPTMRPVDHMRFLDKEVERINSPTTPEAPEVSARADTSNLEEAAMKDLARAKTYTEQKQIMERLQAVTETVDEATGDLVPSVKPVQEAVEEMQEINSAFKDAYDCLFN